MKRPAPDRAHGAGQNVEAGHQAVRVVFGDGGRERTLLQIDDDESCFHRLNLWRNDQYAMLVERRLNHPRCPAPRTSRHCIRNEYHPLETTLAMAVIEWARKPRVIKHSGNDDAVVRQRQAVPPPVRSPKNPPSAPMNPFVFCPCTLWPQSGTVTSVP
jgi:hypothetical protein